MVSTDLTEPATATGTLPSAITWVPIKAIRTDHSVNTRPIDFSWVDREAARFDADRLGVPIVSEREDGTFIVIDGQNRVELCRRQGWSDRSIECRVFKGLTKSQEAELFLGHNNGRPVSVFAKFLARITAGDPDAAAIARIVNEAGWEITQQPGDGKLAAVGSLERIWRGAPSDANGYKGASLKLTLTIATHAWGYSRETAHGQVLLGLGLFCNLHGNNPDLDIPTLIKRLTAYQGQATGILGAARGLRAFQGGTLASCVAAVIVRTYNTRRTTGRLPEWHGVRTPIED